MPSLTVYLNDTTEEQFRNWLHDTWNKARQTYYPGNEWIISFNVHGISNTPPDAPYISLGASIVQRVKTPKTRKTPKGSEKILTFERPDRIIIKWLPVGKRLRVMFRCATLVMPAVFDILEVMARDWTETRRDIWEFVNEAAAKYNMRFATGEYGYLCTLDVSRFPAPQVENVTAKIDNPKRIKLPTKKGVLRKWASTYEFYKKYCRAMKMNARAFRVFFETYDGWDKQTVWMPDDDEVLQAIIDYGNEGKIPEYDSIE